MAQSKDNKGSTANRGFGSMEDGKQREVSSKGGHASAQGGNTSNRGFASMNKDKQRDISRQGGRASQGQQGGAGDQSEASQNQQDKDVKRGTHHDEGGSTPGRSEQGRQDISPVSQERLEVRGGDIRSELDISEKDLNSLEEEDEVAESRRGQASYSETDEDEDEGVGDGNFGRSYN